MRTSSPARRRPRWGAIRALVTDVVAYRCPECLDRWDIVLGKYERIFAKVRNAR